MLTTARNLWAQTVWGSVGRKKIEPERLFMMQIGYPFFDVCCILFGIFGSIGGVPALQDTYGESWATFWAYALGVGGFVCLIGVAFPVRRFRKIEYAGKSFLTGMIACYAIAVFIAGIQVGEAGRFAVGFIVAAVNIIPFSRVVELARGGFQ